MKIIFTFFLLIITLNVFSSDKSDQKVNPKKEYIFMFEDEFKSYNNQETEKLNELLKKSKNTDDYNKIIKDLNNNKKNIILIKQINDNNKDLKAPDVEFKDLNSSKIYSLSKFKGKTVVFGIFEKNYQFLWEFNLLDKIQKIFPNDVIVVLGLIGLSEEEIRKIIEKNKLTFIVIDAEDIYDKWPDNFHAKRKKQGNTFYDLTNTNFVINTKGLVQGYFKENLIEWTNTDFSIQDLIETEIRKYFESNLDIKSNKLPLTLVEAARNNDIDSVRKLVKTESDINAFENNFTALHYAVKNNNTDIASILIDNGAYINLRERNIEYLDSPVDMAVKNNSKDMIKILTRSIKNEKELSEYCGKAMVKIIQYYDNDDMAEYLIKNNIKDKNMLIFYCSRAIKYAAEKNKLQLIRLLISNNADVNYGYPLLESVKSDERLEITKFLIENGANIFIADFSGNTPYQIAKTGNQIKTINYLENIYKVKEKKSGNLIIFAKEKMDYKTILKYGFKPKLNPDYQFPVSQQGRLDCYGYTVKHLIQYKYNETIDVNKINKEYGDAWISMHEDEFAELNNLNSESFVSINLFFYYLITGEPVIINYLYTYANSNTIRHYAVAYSFDEQGVWLADSAGGKRHRKTYDFLLEGGSEIWFQILRKK